MKNMGYDATNYVPKFVSKNKLYKFIELLGFVHYGNTFHFYKNDEYKYLYGVWLDVDKDDNGWVCHTRTPIYCSEHDLKYQNFVIREIKQYLGGYFITDYGKNRYFKVDDYKSTISERGCYNAHSQLNNLFVNAYYLLSTQKEDEKIIKAHKEFGVPSSSVFLSNIVTTYIASIIENYFRDTYVALLTNSEKKEKIFLDARINNNDLVDVSENKISIEMAVALSKSFQNINKINAYFQAIDKNIDIKGVSSKLYHRRNETLYMTLNRILENRHSLVHRLIINDSYYKEDIKKDIKSVEAALDKVYHKICDLYHWEYVNTF